MADDMTILRRALDFENKRGVMTWDVYNVGASRGDINRLLQAELIVLKSHASQLQPGQYSASRYRLTEKGRQLAADQEQVSPTIPAFVILDAMSLIVGFEDLKDAIARAIEDHKRIHFLLEGPPACAKSILLEAVRSAVPTALMAFGSRTSGRGLSDALFEKKPSILLMDEADKMRHDVFSLMLGLMATGEVIETKSGNTRGLKLQTMVIGACNSSKKMPPEFLSRFAMHAHFPHYTREEFIDICRSFLTRSEGCPDELSEKIGRLVFDNSQGDVRKAMGVWQLMHEPTDEEVLRVLRMMAKYSTGKQSVGSSHSTRLI